jgi:tripeptide aminopeptidase
MISASRRAVKRGAGLAFDDPTGQDCRKKNVFLTRRRTTLPERTDATRGEGEDRLVDLFCALASIPSPSGLEGRCAEAVSDELRDLGLAVESDGLGPALGSDAGNLYCRLPATAPGRPLFFCAHLDTVPPTATLEPVIMDGEIRNASPSIVGADNKAALAVMLDAVRTVITENLPHAGLELVFTIGEERGLVGSTAFDCSVLRAQEGFVFDHPGAIGGYVAAAPSRFIVRAAMHGRAAHSAIAPETGVNAIVPLAEAISRFPTSSPAVNVNVALIEGGSALNVVPGIARVTVDVRSTEHSEAEAVAGAIGDMLRDAAQRSQCRLEVDVGHPYSAYRLPEDSAALGLARAAFARHGLPPTPYETRGGSDANAFRKRGLDCVNLTHAVVGFHADDERVAVSDLALMRTVMLTIIAEALDADR